MPSAVLQLIFPVAGIAFLVLLDVPELNGVFRCWPARSRCRCPNVGFVPLPLPRALRGLCPFLKDCDAGTLGWRQQVWVLFLLPLLCCLSFEPRWTLDFCFFFFFGHVPWDDKLLVAGTMSSGCAAVSSLEHRAMHTLWTCWFLHCRHWWSFCSDPFDTLS